MKKLLAILLAVAMIFALVACGDKEDAAKDATDTEAAEASEKDKEESKDKEEAESDEEEEEEEEETKETKPITPSPKDTAFGDFTLSAEHIPFDEPIIVGFSKEPSMDLLGNKLYVSDGDKTIRVYTLEGSALTLDKELGIDTRGPVGVDGSGNIYANGGVFEAKVYDADGNETGQAAASGEITISKNQDFALSYFSGNKAITKMSGGAAEDWVIKDLGSVSEVGKFHSVNAVKIQGSHVLVGGSDSEKGLIAAYDFSGNQLFVSTDDPDGNLPEQLAETANGYMSTSAYTLNLFSKEGTLIGAEDTTDLFGVERAWIYGLIPIQDGSVLALITNTSEDADTSEILLFKLTGF